MDSRGLFASFSRPGNGGWWQAPEPVFGATERLGHRQPGIANIGCEGSVSPEFPPVSPRGATSVVEFCAVPGLDSFLIASSSSAEALG